MHSPTRADISPGRSWRSPVLRERHDSMVELDRREQIAIKELAQLVDATGSTLCELGGLTVRSAAESTTRSATPPALPLAALLGQRDRPAAGVLRRGGRRAGPAPPEPRRQQARQRVVHRMAVIQLRCEPRAQKIYADARRTATTRRKRCASSKLAPPERRRVPADGARPARHRRRGRVWPRLSATFLT